MEKKYEKYIFILEVAGLLLGLLQWYQSDLGFSGVLKREELGGDSYTQELNIQGDDFSKEYDLEIDAVAPTEEEAEELFSKAIVEIDDTFPGQNKDLDNVTSDLLVKDSYVDDLVEASWGFSDYTCLSADGKIDYTALTEEKIVEATVELSFSDYEEVYSFSFCLQPAKADSPEGILREVFWNIQNQDASKKEVILPKEVGNQEIKWTKKATHDGGILSLLGLVLFLVLPLAKKQEERQSQKKENEKLSRDYPLLVNQLSLYMSAGMGLREAAGKIVENNEKRKEKIEEHPGFAHWNTFYYEMCDGVMESRAIENFGQSCDKKEYKKLALLLQQNQTRGGENFLLQLEQENILAYEMRKNQARKAGEEASVKLLFPMLGMLGIVIVVLIVPALLTMGSM